MSDETIDVEPVVRRRRRERLERRRRVPDVGVVLLVLVSYVPLLLTRPGRVGADTKTYLYLDPARLLSRAAWMWDPNVGLGTVTHQNIGYLWPLGPYYWLMDTVGVPDWVAQRIWLGTIVGYGYLRWLKPGLMHWEGVTRLSDTLMIDGRIATVFAGTRSQRERLVAALDALESSGSLRYGMQVCSESVMSCYVRDRRNDHIHFVDGMGGGYTRAATMLKAKLAKA